MATTTKYFSPGKPVKPAQAAPKTVSETVSEAPAAKASSKPRTSKTAKTAKPAGPSTKEKIERAALTLFAASGVDGVSTKDLAFTAGVSEGVIYRYFKSKDELARSLMVAGHKHLADLVRAAEQSPGRLSEKVAAIVTGYCAFADESPDAFAYYLLHFHRFKDLATDAGDSPARAATDIVESAQARGEIPGGDAALKAAMALGCVLQTATAKLYGQISGGLSDYAAPFQAAVMAVLLSDAR